MDVHSMMDYKRPAADNFYELLGCDPRSTTEQIISEYRWRARALHPDKTGANERGGGHGADEFQLLQRAKETLCDTQLRRIYDQWYSSGLAVPWDQYKATRSMHSMHWANKRTAAPALQNDQCKMDANTEMGKRCSAENMMADRNILIWSTSSDKASEMLQKFRNYEI